MNKISFKEDGLHWEKEEELDFDDGEDEFESHGYCQDCGEELWSSEDDTNISKTRNARMVCL